MSVPQLKGEQTMKLLSMILTIVIDFFLSVVKTDIKLFFRWTAELFHNSLFNYMSRSGMILGAVTLPNKSVVAIANSYGPVKSMTAVTNANPAVATLEASHDVLDDDILEVTSGWSRLLNDRIVKAGGVSTNDVNIEGIDTTNVVNFPAGIGIGSIREILGWTALSQILSAESSGGEQQFLQYQLLEADQQIQIPTVKNPVQIAIQVADDLSLAGYQLALVANDDGLPRAVRLTLPSGTVLYYNAYISATRTPTLTVNEIMAQTITLSLLSVPVRY